MRVGRLGAWEGKLKKGGVLSMRVGRLVVQCNAAKIKIKKNPLTKVSPFLY